MSLFEYYVESRKIDHSYERLVDLVVYDRIKRQLTPFLATVKDMKVPETKRQVITLKTLLKLLNR